MQPTISVLLVEDDEAIRSLLQDALHDGGFEVTALSNADEAIAIVERHEDAFRGLITDVSLGKGPNGWDLARRFRELRPDIPVVYMSGGSAHEWASQGVPHSTMVPKPFAPIQIVTAISMLLNASDTHP